MIIFWFWFYSVPDTAGEAFDKGIGIMIQLDVYLNSKKLTVYGFGQNKKEAKIAAAKIALKNIKNIM